MVTVLVVEDAEEQLRQIADWWLANRPSAPMLPLDEFERCTTLLAHSPDIGARFRRSDVPGVRRLLMGRTKCFVYYLHDTFHGCVYVLAVWGAPKFGAPLLRDPRA